MSDRHAAEKCLHHWPTRFLCVLLVALQAVSINWYLMKKHSFTWAAIFGADFVVIALFVIAILMASRNIYKEKHTEHVTADYLQHLPMMYIAWFVYAILLDVKVAVIFMTFSTDLDDVYFFGPNTQKPTLALSATVFLTFLPAKHDVKSGTRKTLLVSQHDVKSGTRKALLVSLTSTVIFDILDGIDILDNLFDKAVRDTFPPNLDDAIVAIFCVNFLLPTVPLFTLAKTKFALNPFPERLEMFHKFAIAFLVNFPLFVIRMITWHGLSQGISIFLLKNVIAMGAITFEMLEHFLCTGSEEEKAKELDTKRKYSHLTRTAS